jgi:uncharacterized protein (TIGR00730 family)
MATTTPTPILAPARTGPVICVFCGATSGNSPIYLEAASALARSLHEHNATLIYGGGTVGIMGEVARTLVSLSGPTAVHGIIPRALMEREKGFQHSTSTSNGKDKEKKDWTTAHISDDSKASGTGTSTPLSLSETTEIDPQYGYTTTVASMHARKALMARYVLAGPPGSGFVALPGGYGTLEELMEIVTWNQLGIHKAGIVVLNVGEYWDGLLEWVRNAVKEGFVGEGNRGIIVECRSVEEVVGKLREYRVAEGRFVLDWGDE